MFSSRFALSAKVWIVAGSLAASPALAAERLPGNEDSVVALSALVAIALAAFGLAATRYAIHRFAVGFTGLLLVAGGVALAAIERAGHFETFKKAVTPLDAIKVPVLRADMLIGILVGLFLIYTALRMRSVDPESQIDLRNEPQNFGKISRFLHWVIALIIITLFPMGVLMSGLPEGDALREPLYIIHKSLGMTLLLLVVARIGWHLVSRPPAIASDLSRANRIGAKTAHIFLYLLIILFPVSGYFMSSFFGKIVPFYFVDLPSLVTPSKAAALPFGGLHKFLLPVVFYLVFAAHVAGVIKHHFLDGKRQAIRRMSG